MRGKSCEFLDCGYCFDSSKESNASSDGSCSDPEECEVLKLSDLIRKSKNKKNSVVHHSSGVMDIYSK